MKGPRRRTVHKRGQAPIDPGIGPAIALQGRVVLMDSRFQVIDNGIVYINKGEIVAVQERNKPAPPEFGSIHAVDTGGTLYPGLIELHNHLSYNALKLWDVPKAYANRDRWGGTPLYRKSISGPMTVVGKTPRLLPALVRYVECKCLLSGVTTTQGIQLASNAGVRRFYRGIVRNVEQTNEAELPEAAARIADVEAQDARLFLARLQKQTCFLLHLAEGVDDIARNHFLALRLEDDEWAITPQLAGIHCAGLEARDFDVLAQHGGATIWSPMSNLLLYGKTANIEAAKRSGVRLAIGSDWSPTGSKNLLGELKAARLYSQAAGGVLSDRDLVKMATSGAASILDWDQELGSLEAGKRADILVIEGQDGDPYEALIRAKETAVQLVLINGIARYGTPELMGSLCPEAETIRVGGLQRQVYLQQATQDPDVAAVDLGEAMDTLKEAFKDMPKLAKELEKPKPLPRAAAMRALDRPEPVVWSLALDEIQETGVDLRPRLPFGPARALSGPSRIMAKAAPPLSTVLEPMSLDAITVADDADFLERIANERNLPEAIKHGLPTLY